MIEEFDKLKNQFAIELNYRNYDVLDKITGEIFNLIQDYINSQVNKDNKITAIQTAKDKAEKAHKNADLREFIIQIDVVTLLLTNPYYEDDIKIDFSERMDNSERTERILNWVQEKKEILREDPRFFLRLNQKIADLMAKL